MRFNAFFQVTALVAIPLIINNYAFAQHEDPLNPEWSRYHDTEESYKLLHEWAHVYPELASVYSIGETLNGTPLLVLEITNKKNGKSVEKTCVLL